MSVIRKTPDNKMRCAILIILSIQCVYEVSGLLVIFMRAYITAHFDLSMTHEKKGFFAYMPGNNYIFRVTQENLSLFLFHEFYCFFL
jgi:hypothetical protein